MHLWFNSQFTYALDGEWGITRVMQLSKEEGGT